MLHSPIPGAVWTCPSNQGLLTWSSCCRTSTDSNAGKQPDLGTSLTAATQVAAALTVASPAQQSTSPSPEYKALYEDTAAELEKARWLRL